MAAHMQDHMKLHLQAQADAQAAIRMAHGHPPQPNPEHERAKYNRPRLAIDVDELFEDMDSDEFERLKKASGGECKKGAGIATPEVGLRNVRM